jgi:hypothetical protein
VKPINADKVIGYAVVISNYGHNRGKIDNNIATPLNFIGPVITIKRLKRYTKPRQKLTGILRMPERESSVFTAVTTQHEPRSLREIRS